MTMKRMLLVVGILAVAARANAGQLALNVGALEVVGLPHPAHLGLYPSVALSMAIQGPGLTLIPALGVEWAPELGRGGLVATLTSDWAMNDWLGLDLGVTLVHDQPGMRLSESLFYLGAGPGFSVFLGPWSLSAYVDGMLGLADGSWSLTPGLNLARTL
jgi:hypothetical protein